MSHIQLEEGRRYVTRSGLIIGPLKRNGNHPYWTFRTDDGLFYRDGYTVVTDDGLAPHSWYEENYGIVSGVSLGDETKWHIFKYLWAIGDYWAALCSLTWINNKSYGKNGDRIT